MGELLDVLGLSQYREAFDEEELSEDLLRSMSEVVLGEALIELGVSADHQLLLKAALGHAVAELPPALVAVEQCGAEAVAPPAAVAVAHLASEAVAPPDFPSSSAAAADEPPSAEEPNSPEARSRRRREAAEAGRRLAQAVRDLEVASVIEAEAEGRAMAERRRQEEMDVRRARGAKLADQMEARAKAAPAVVPEPPAASSGPRPRVPTPASAIVPPAAAVTDAEARARRIHHMRDAKRRQAAERANLLAEAKADRAHRRARTRGAAPTPPNGGCCSGDVGGGMSSDVDSSGGGACVGGGSSTPSAPISMDASAVAAHVAAVHASLTAAGTHPNEAAALALEEVRLLRHSLPSAAAAAAAAAAVAVCRVRTTCCVGCGRCC